MSVDTLLSTDVAAGSHDHPTLHNAERAQINWLTSQIATLPSLAAMAIESADSDLAAALDKFYGRGITIDRFGTLGVGSDAAVVQAAFDELGPLVGTAFEKALVFPNRTYLYEDEVSTDAGLTLIGASFTGCIQRIGASFPAGGVLMSFIRTTESPVQPENHVPGLSITTMTFDGDLRRIEAHALKLDRFDRAHINVRVNAFKGSALIATHSLRESEITLRTWLCADGVNDHPTIDLDQAFSTSTEGANLNMFSRCILALSCGDDLRSRTAYGAVARVNNWVQCVFHSLNEWVDDYVDMYGTPLTLDHEGDIKGRIVVDNARTNVFDNCRMHLNGRGQPKIYLSNASAGASTVNTMQVNGSVMSYRGNAYTARSILAVDTAANTIELAGVATNRHHYQTGSRVRAAGQTLPSVAALPGGIVAATDYYVVVVDDTRVKLSDTRAHALAGTNIVDITSAGAGSLTQYDTAVVVDAAANTLTAANHRITTGARYRADAAAMPGGLATNTDYFVIRVDKDTIKFAATRADARTGTAIDITSAGTAVYISPRDFVVHVESGTFAFDGNTVEGVANTYGYVRQENATTVVLGITNVWPSGSGPVVERADGGQHTFRMDGALQLTRNNHPLYLTKADGSAVQALRMTTADVVAIGSLTGTANVELNSVNGIVVVKGGGTERMRFGSTGVGFFGHAESARPAVAGSRGGNAALQSLLSGLDGLGLIQDGSTA